MKTCAIVYNGSLNSEKFLYQVRWLERVASELSYKVTVIGNHELIPMVEGGQTTLKGKYAGYEPDFFFFWDKDIRLARHLEKMGFKLYNNARSIEICDDKSLTFEVLANHGLRLPKTITAPMVFENCELEDQASYEFIMDEIGFPMVVKEAFGSFGEQVYLVKNPEEFRQIVRKLQHRPHVYQELISSSYGRDIRINVIGDHVAASMLRKSETDFRANVSAGGKMYPYRPTEEEKKLAVTCAQLVGADFAGVDLLFGPDGEPYVCEVNSNAHFKNIFECTGIDLAVMMVDYIRTKHDALWRIKNNMIHKGEAGQGR
ncbi:MAG: RimK family alpha-L-glutamate ligase [Gorillibacterium sp.]|nr:RimK family alpha-L-glutamate ligase [Gorillibacterium sp.]